MWRKNRVRGTKKETQKWMSIARELYVTGTAYELRLVLQGIYECKDLGDARKLFRN